MYCYNLVLLIFNYVFKLKMYVCIHQFIINHSHVYILWESPYLFLYLIPRVNNIKYVTHIVYIAHNMSQGLTHALTTLSYIQVKTGFCTNGGNIYMYDSTKVIMVIPKICTMITCNIHKINIALFNEDLFQLLRWHAWNNAYLHNYIVVIIILIVFLFLCLQYYMLEYISISCGKNNYSGFNICRFPNIPNIVNHSTNLFSYIVHQVYNITLNSLSYVAYTKVNILCVYNIDIEILIAQYNLFNPRHILQCTYDLIRYIIELCNHTVYNVKIYDFIYLCKRFSINGIEQHIIILLLLLI